MIIAVTLGLQTKDICWEQVIIETKKVFTHCQTSATQINIESSEVAFNWKICLQIKVKYLTVNGRVPIIHTTTLLTLIALFHYSAWVHYFLVLKPHNPSCARTLRFGIRRTDVRRRLPAAISAHRSRAVSSCSLFVPSNKRIATSDFPRHSATHWYKKYSGI